MSKSIRLKNDYYLDGSSIWQYHGDTVTNGVKKLTLSGKMWLLALYNEWGNFGFYILNKATSGTNQSIIITTLKESSLITITSENRSEITITSGQIVCPIYLMKIC